MPRYDGTGPRGEGMFTGRGEGYCALRLPEPGSGEPAVGYAGIQGRPVRLATSPEWPPAPADADAQARLTHRLCGQPRRCRYGKQRCEGQRLAVR